MRIIILMALLFSSVNSAEEVTKDGKVYLDLTVTENEREFKIKDGLLEWKSPKISTMGFSQIRIFVWFLSVVQKGKPFTLEANLYTETVSGRTCYRSVPINVDGPTGDGRALIEAPVIGKDTSFAVYGHTLPEDLSGDVMVTVYLVP